MKLLRVFTTTALSAGLIAAGLYVSAPATAVSHGAHKHAAHKAPTKKHTATHQTKRRAHAPLTREQQRNARTIIAVGRQHKVGDRAIKIALMAALQESSLRNLGGGDRDSIGLFQQRPSQGWGTPKKLRDPVYAARAFYGVNPATPFNPGLKQVRGWKTKKHGKVAQAVQRSAYPRAYDKWAPTADWLISVS